MDVYFIGKKQVFNFPRSPGKKISFLTPGRQGSGSTKNYLKISRSDRKSSSSSFVEKSWKHSFDLK